MLFYDIVKTGLGYMALVFKQNHTLVYISLPEKNKENLLKRILNKINDSIKPEIFPERDLFISYFSGKKTEFSKLKIDLDYFSPTEFQKSVWSACALVPYGNTITYKQLGIIIGSTAYRAIGNSLAKNPLPLIIPCHRILSKNSLGGFSASEGIALKKKMLSLEGIL